MTEPIYQYQLIYPDGAATDWRETNERAYWALVHKPKADVRVRRAWVLDAEPLATNAELVALLPGTYYLDPPDGGGPDVLTQLQRMAADAARWRAYAKQFPHVSAGFLMVHGDAGATNG